MKPPVGKSGPLMCRRSSVTSVSGLSMSAIVAATTSRMLCGGMLVAMPTAMPELPLTSRFGSIDGITFGSCRRSSKLGWKSTVFLSMSASISIATRVSRASV